MNRVFRMNKGDFYFYKKDFYTFFHLIRYSSVYKANYDNIGLIVAHEIFLWQFFPNVLYNRWELFKISF